MPLVVTISYVQSAIRRPDHSLHRYFKLTHYLHFTSRISHITL
jgi:hypothetical protein